MALGTDFWVADIDVSKQKKHLHRKVTELVDCVKASHFQKTLERLEVEVVDMVRNRNPPRVLGDLFLRDLLNLRKIIRHTESDKAARPQHLAQFHERFHRLRQVLKDI